MRTVSIDSAYATSVAEKITASSSSLEELSNSIETKFQVLIELGLISNCISAIKNQINGIIEAGNKISSSISSHISSMTDAESQLNNGFISGISGGYSGGNYGGSSDSPSTVVDKENTFTKEEFNIQEINEGKKINVSSFEKIISTFDFAKNIKLLKLLNLNKGSQDSIKNLLLDDSKSKVLFTTLKKVFNNCFSFAELSDEEVKQIQKVLLTELFSSKNDIPDLKDNALFNARDYLSEISEENKIEIGDLILDKENDKLLKDSLKKLYTGNVENNIKTSSIEQFRDSVDSLAKTNGISAEELLDNKIDLLL